MAEFPVVGPTYADRSLDANAQRTVNWYVEHYKDPSSGDDIYSLYDLPGFELWKHGKNGEARCTKEFGQYLYTVIGNTAYRVDSGGGFRYLGTLGTTTGKVSAAYNGTHVVFVDGPNGYYYTVDSDVWTEITDDAFYGATHVVFADGWFVFNRPGTGQFYWPKQSYRVEPFDGNNFATAEAIPDNLVSMLAYRNILFLFGETTVEPWNYTGKKPPWSPMRQSIQEWGCVAPYTPVIANNIIYWLSRGVEGRLQFKKMSGVSPEDVSTNALVAEWQTFSKVDDAFTFAFQLAGHTFIYLTFPTADRTYVYDTTSNMWTEAGEWDKDRQIFLRHRANCHAMLNGEHIIGDFSNGKLYKMSADIFDYDGRDMVRLRRCAHLHNSRKGFSINCLRLNVETGYGIENTSTEPQIMVRQSKDRGRTWSSSRNASIGAVGDYAKPIELWQWGWAQDALFELSVNAAVRATIRDGHLEADPCEQ